MARLPYAAKRLIEQVQAERKKATYKEAADPDGLGVVRSIKFDKSTSKWLAPLVEQFEDERIKEVEVTEAGYLHVTFTGGIEADNVERFPLREAIAVSRETKAPEPEA